MGGCCCSSRRVALNTGEHGYQNCPRASVEHDPFSLQHGISIGSTDVLVDTNLGTNTEIFPSDATLDVGVAHTSVGTNLGTDTEIFPSDATPDVGVAHTSHDVDASDKTALVQTAEAQPIEDTVRGTHEDLKGPDVKTVDDPLPGSPKLSDEKNSKLDEAIPLDKDEEDVCPTCLEEFDEENPKIITNCGHHFHLSCILEWMERSDNCAVCNQVMIFNEHGNF